MANKETNKILIKLIGTNKIDLTKHINYIVLTKIAKKSKLTPTEIDLILQKIVDINKKPIKSKQTEKDWKNWLKYNNILCIIQEILLRKGKSLKKIDMDVNERLKIIDTIQNKGSLSGDNIFVLPWGEYLDNRSSTKKEIEDAQKKWELIHDEWQKKCGLLCKYWWWVGGSGGDDDQWKGPTGTSKIVINHLRNILSKYGKNNWPIANSYEELRKLIHKRNNTRWGPVLSKKKKVKVK